MTESKNKHGLHIRWYNVFKSGPSKICGRQPLKNLKGYGPICSQCTLSLSPENIRKPWGILMFSGGRERVQWEQMS